MNCAQLANILENTFPKEFAMEWDNVGLLVGNTEKEVKKIYVALDVTEKAISEAIIQEADMMLTHHPLLFSPLKKITNEQFIGDRVLKLIRHDICHYAMHTNYDVVRMSAVVGTRLNIYNQSVLEVTGVEGHGIGISGTLENNMSLKSCAEYVKNQFALSGVKVYGDEQCPISKVAVVPGSGKNYIEHAIKAGAQVLITGDINHHEGLDAMDQGLNIIDAGHYGLEHPFIEDVAGWLTKQLPDITIIKEAIKEPFYIC